MYKSSWHKAYTNCACIYPYCYQGRIYVPAATLNMCMYYCLSLGYCYANIYMYYCLSFEIQLHKMFVKFLHQIINYNYPLVYACGVLALGGRCSAACNSLNVILPKYNLDKLNFLNKIFLYSYLEFQP